MRHFFFFTILMGMAGITFAQTNTANWPLDDAETPPKAYQKLIPEEKRVVIPLTNGNTMIIGLQTNEDLRRFRNMDSLLAIFQQDLAQIKDTLTVSTNTHKLWYRLQNGERHVRLWNYPPAFTQIQFEAQENLLVKNLPDTVIVEQIFSETRLLTDTQQRKNANATAVQVPATYTGYFKIYFLVNSLDDLQKIIQNKVNDKVEKSIADMQTYPKGSLFDTRLWASEVRYTAENQPAVIKINKQVKPDQLLIIPRLGMGLVGNTFMSTVGANVILLPQIPTHYGRIHTTTQSDGFMIGWERMFAFGRATDGRLSIAANDFVSLGMAGFKADPYRQGHKMQWAEFKVSYLIRRQGEYFQPNTFRISTAFSPYISAKGFQRLRLEPELYFHDFFKRAYPGLRVSLGF